jgi:hypothetical protein
MPALRFGCEISEGWAALAHSMFLRRRLTDLEGGNYDEDPEDHEVAVREVQLGCTWNQGDVLLSDNGPLRAGALDLPSYWTTHRIRLASAYPEAYISFVHGSPG